MTPYVVYCVMPPIGCYTGRMDLKHIHPDDVTPDGVRLPRFVVRIAQTRSPAREYFHLQSNFAELMPYAVRDEPIPLSVIETLPEPDEDSPAMTSSEAERFRVALASETHRHKEAVTRLAAAERDRDRYKKALHKIYGLVRGSSMLQYLTRRVPSGSKMSTYGWKAIRYRRVGVLRP